MMARRTCRSLSEYTRAVLVALLEHTVTEADTGLGLSVYHTTYTVGWHQSGARYGRDESARVRARAPAARAGGLNDRVNSESSAETLQARGPP